MLPKISQWQPTNGQTKMMLPAQLLLPEVVGSGLAGTGDRGWDDVEAQVLVAVFQPQPMVLLQAS